MKPVGRVLMIGAVLVAFLVTGIATRAGATTPAAPALTTSTFYLDVGGSASVGFQPTSSEPKGLRTDDGYANDLVALEATKGLSLQLDEIGCPGETTETLLHGGDRCYQLPDTQLTAAVSFLRAHRTDDGLVTVDLGFNDLRSCLAHLMIDESCVDERVSLVREQLSQILTDLLSAAGPGVHFVGIGHYDPFLAAFIDGPTGQAFAVQSVGVVKSLDQSLEAVYADHGIPYANVASVFETQDADPVFLAGVGTVPNDVARVCELTWMCHSRPFGPNPHPDDLGYEAITDAIVAALPTSW